MLAPIALYPDQLLADILMAVTYPREVVAAYRWLQEPNDSALHGDQLAAALQDQAWDPSVKALVVFPDVVRMIDGNLQWAEQLGDAFMGQQGEVIDEIQHLRKMAIAANVLKSTQAQTVTTENGIVSIEPTNLNVVYVPIFNPMSVYGEWPYPDYPPDYFTPGYVFGGALIDFGIGIPIVSDLFFFHHFDFQNHRIDIDDRHFRSLNGDREPIRSGVWAHDPSHRHDVPHHAPALQGSAGGPTHVVMPVSQRPYRGYGVGNAASTPNVSPEKQRAPANEMQRPSASVFESHTTGSDVRAQSIRGQSSRSQVEIPRGGSSQLGGGSESHGHGGGNSHGGGGGFSGGSRGHR